MKRTLEHLCVPWSIGIRPWTLRRCVLWAAHRGLAIHAQRLDPATVISGLARPQCMPLLMS